MPPRRRTLSEPGDDPAGAAATTPASFANLTRLIQKPAVFDGRGNLSAFIFSLTTYLTLLEVGLGDSPALREVQKLLIASSFLSGYALLWFRANKESFRTFADFEAAIRRQFGDLQLATTCRRKLEQLRQNHNSVASYTAAFNEIALQLGADFLTSEEGYHCYMRGLRDDCRINVTLTLRGQHNAIEAQALAAEYDAARSTMFVPRNSDRRADSRVNSAQIRDSRVKRDLSKIRCFNCGKMGHYQSQCKETDAPKNERR
jgi:hypothetical protein